MPKLIGIDYGTKRVGIAVTDDSGSVAFPKETIPNDARLLDRIASLIREEGAAEAVLGESKNAEGIDNRIMEEARAFAERLRETAGVPVRYEPEFYSSVTARRDTGMSKVDAEAAAIILNSYIVRTKRP